MIISQCNLKKRTEPDFKGAISRDWKEMVMFKVFTYWDTYPVAEPQSIFEIPIPSIFSNAN